MKTMRTANDQLQWAVRDFIQPDLRLFREGDWLNLREELTAFLGFGIEQDSSEVQVISRPPRADEDLQALQAEARKFLESAISLRDTGSGASKRLELGKPSLSLIVSKSGLVLRTVDLSSARDGFLMKLWLLVGELGAANVRRCPECRAIFWRIKRQLYCSRTCSTRVNMRAYVGRRNERAKSKKGARS